MVNNTLIHDVDISKSESDLSVAFGMVNVGDDDKAETNISEIRYILARIRYRKLIRSIEIAQNILSVASRVTGPVGVAFSLMDVFLDHVPALLDCAGPVVLGRVAYSPEQLNDLKVGTPLCANETYSLDVLVTCGPRNSSYTVDHCLEVVKRTIAGDDGEGGGDGGQKSGAASFSASSAFVSAMIVAVTWFTT